MKKILTVICCLLTFGLIFAGCSSVSSITNSYDGIIYNGNASVMVDGYLYYGNSYSDVSAYGTENTSDYDAAKATAYLARLNTNVERDAKGKNFTPNGNETVLNEVIAQDHQFMFVLGNYIYYLRPDTDKYIQDESSSQQFTYSMLCSIKLNGDSQRNIYQFESEVTEIEVLEFNGNYYVVALAGENLYSIRLDNGKGRATTLSENVTSAAIPETYQKNLKTASDDWNGKIYFTVSNDDGTFVKFVDVTSTSSDDVVTISRNDSSVSFLDRKNDIIFYTNVDGTQTRTYYNNVKNITNNDQIINGGKLLINDSSVSNIYVMNYGTSLETIIFTDSSSNLRYKRTLNNPTSANGLFTIQDSDGNELSATVMFINDTNAYLISSTGIYEVSFAKLASGNVSEPLVARTVITMTAIQTTGELYSFDGTYIYYYAQLEELSDEEQELIDKEKADAGIEEDTSDSEDSSDSSDSTAITDEDAGYYLYRVAVSNTTENTTDYELLGTTSFDERHSSYVYKK